MCCKPATSRRGQIAWVKDRSTLFRGRGGVLVAHVSGQDDGGVSFVMQCRFMPRDTITPCHNVGSQVVIMATIDARRTSMHKSWDSRRPYDDDKTETKVVTGGEKTVKKKRSWRLIKQACPLAFLPGRDSDCGRNCGCFLAAVGSPE